MPKSTNIPKKQTVHTKNSRNPIISIAISMGAGIIALFISLCIISVILTKSSDPDAFLPAGAIACACISGITCGITSAAVSPKALPLSVISGLFMLVIFLILSLPFDSVQQGSSMLFKTAICLCVVVCAAVACALRTKKPDKRIVRR